ncbi:MAG: nicotinate (nicotinamide) nucleotide adenylyltransferase [Oscillospiraceae bacterium]|nr:nicotinate (nicotinamide) nucleotide adenylyltransferase [Oscillospiraceae bacterium]
MRKILLYGGSFDPPHRGHERLLRAAVEAVRPDRTLVIPTDVAPHKRRSKTPFALRMHMARVFERDIPGVRVSGLERAGGRQKSYTLKTLKRVRGRYPDAQLYFLIGSDMLLSFRTWHRWRRVLRAAILVVASREQDDRAALEAQVRSLEKLGGRILLLPIAALPLSSSEVRRTAAAGGDIGGMVSPFVEDIIRRHSLYTGDATKQ